MGKSRNKDAPSWSFKHELFLYRSPASWGRLERAGESGCMSDAKWGRSGPGIFHFLADLAGGMLDELTLVAEIASISCNGERSSPA